MNDDALGSVRRARMSPIGWTARSGRIAPAAPVLATTVSGTANGRR